MAKFGYAPKLVKNSEKIFLPDHPCSDKQGFISIKHPGLLNELMTNIKKDLNNRSAVINNANRLMVSNKISDKY